MYRQDLDLIVKRKDGTEPRTLTIDTPYPEEGEDKRTILRTILSKDKFSHTKVSRLYRLRWSIEIFNKCLKSGNSMAGVNSLKANIIVEMVMFSLIASLIKTYYGMKAIGEKGMEELSMLNLHRNFNSSFSDAINALITKGRSSISQIFKELVAEISQPCLRAKPSERDTLKLKDLPLLIRSILTPDAPYAEFSV